MDSETPEVKHATARPAAIKPAYPPAAPKLEAASDYPDTERRRGLLPIEEG